MNTWWITRRKGDDSYTGMYVFTPPKMYRTKPMAMNAIRSSSPEFKDMAPSKIEEKWEIVEVSIIPTAICRTKLILGRTI